MVSAMVIRLLLSYVSALHALVVVKLRHLHAGEHRLHALARHDVLVHLRCEAHTSADDVVLWLELLEARAALRLQSYAEGAQTLNLHAVRVEQLGLHHLRQLGEHGEDVRILHGTVRLHYLRELPQAHRLAVSRTSLVESLACVVSLALIDLVIHCHNVFSFLFLDLVNTLCFSFCVVFRITFAKVLFCAGDVKYFSIFFQFICRFIYKSLFLQKHTTLILYTEYGEWTS